jgi:hypothetical protein
LNPRSFGVSFNISAPQDESMRDHIRILAILNIIMGGLVALLGCLILLLAGGAATFLGAAIASGESNPSHAALTAPIIAAIGLAIAVFFFLLSLPSIIGGWGLLHYKSWSRVLMIVVSVLHLFHVPLGTALGVYGLWVLLSEEGRRILESGGTYVLQPAYPGYPQRPAV